MGASRPQAKASALSARRARGDGARSRTAQGGTIAQAAAAAVESLEGRRLLSTSVLTYHDNGMRTGLNATETTLTPANVSSGQFGKVFSETLDGNTFAQPLYVPNLSLGARVHNVVFVATEHDSVYAFDANTPGAPLWKTSFLNPAKNVTTIPSADINSYDTYPETGITGTPVIDATTRTLYVVAATKEVSGQTVSYVQRLHALDLLTGKEKFGGPVVIQPSVKGTGEGSVNGVVSFNARTENQRAGLALTNGKVYVTWAAHADHDPAHGWLVGYDAKTLKQAQVFNFSPSGHLDGVWQSGAAPSVDTNGDLLLTTGNGTYDGNTGGPNWGETIMRFGTAGTDLVLKDWFTPSNFDHLNQLDLDLGSGGILLLPDQAGPVPHEALVGGKAGLLYLVNRDNLGHFDPATDHVLQTIQLPSGIYSTPTYFNGAVYIGVIGDGIRRFAIKADGTLDTSSVTVTKETFNYPGTTTVVSSNGASNGIVWAIQVGVPGNLRAYDAGDLSHLLYTTDTAVGRDGPGTTNKFTEPVVADGHVYVAGGGTLNVYGLFAKVGAPPAAPTTATATVSSPTQVDLKWARKSTNETGFKIFRSTDGKTFTQIDVAAAGATQYSDKTASPNTKYVFEVVATNTSGDSAGAFAGPVTTPPAVVVDPSIVGWWKLDEGSGTTTADSSPGADAGTLVGEVTWEAGKVGPAALNFHGTGQIPSYVQIADEAALRFQTSQSFSLGAWVNPAAQPGKDVGVITKAADASGGNGYGIYISAAGKWEFRGGGSIVIGPSYMSGWHYVAVTQDGAAGKRTFYIDGVAVGTGAAADASGAGGMVFGGSEGTADQNFPGKIDDVRVYSRALTADEVAGLAGVTPPPPPGTLIPTDDAYTSDAAKTTNYGATTQLLVEGAAAGQVRQTYLRFDLSGMENINGGKLRLFGGLTGGTAGTSATVQVFAVPSTDWNESTIDFANAPPPAGKAIGTITVTGATAKWYEVDLTTYLQQRQSSGALQVAFALIGASQTSFTATFSSREAPANAPQLIVTTGIPTPPAAPLSASASAVTPNRIDITWQPGSTNQKGFSIYRSTDGQTFTLLQAVPPDSTLYSDLTVKPDTAYTYQVMATNKAGGSAAVATMAVKTPAAPAVVTLGPVGDAYVQDGSVAGSNFGSANGLYVKSGIPGLTRVSYLSFDISSIASATSVKLRLFGQVNTTASQVSPVPVGVYGVADTTWNEGTITNKSAPAVGSALLASATVKSASGQWYDFDVTSYVRANRGRGHPRQLCAEGDRHDKPHRLVQQPRSDAERAAAHHLGLRRLVARSRSAGQGMPTQRGAWHPA